MVNLVCLFLVLVSCNLTFFSFAEDKKAISPVIQDGSKANAEETDRVKTVSYRGKYYWVIYDNVCPYCQSSKEYIKQLDWEGKFKFTSFRNPTTYKTFPELKKEDCEKDVHMVTPDGKVLVGYKVFRAIIDNLTATKLLNPLFKNDYAEQKLTEIYEKMVKERSCYYNKTGTCDLSLRQGSSKSKPLESPKLIETK